MASTAETCSRRSTRATWSGCEPLLDADPTLASARDEQGVSAILRARYRLDRALVAAVAAHDAPDWTCSTRRPLGDARPARHAPRHGSGRSWARTPATASRRCTSRRSSAGPRPCGSCSIVARDVGRARDRVDDRHRAAQRRERVARRRRRTSPGGRRGSERPAVGRVDAAARRGGEREHRDRRGAPVGRRRPEPHERRGIVAGRAGVDRCGPRPRLALTRPPRSRRTRTPARSSRRGCRARSGPCPR